MNENQREVAQRRSPKALVVFAVLHLLCYGLPLLVLAGVSFVWPSWPLIGAVLIALGVAGFIWYLKRGCATCPRNEGRSCSAEQALKPLLGFLMPHTSLDLNATCLNNAGELA